MILSFLPLSFPAFSVHDPRITIYDSRVFLLTFHHIFAQGILPNKASRQVALDTVFPERIASAILEGERLLPGRGRPMDGSLLQPLAGAVFMGLGAGFLTYSYADKFTGKRCKKERTGSPSGYFDPKRPERRDTSRIVKALSVGFFMGVMFFIYFSNR